MGLGHRGSVEPSKHCGGAGVVGLGHRGSVEPPKHRGGARVVGLGHRGSVEPTKHSGGAGVVGLGHRGSVEPAKHSGGEGDVGCTHRGSVEPGRHWNCGMVGVGSLKEVVSVCLGAGLVLIALPLLGEGVVGKIHLGSLLPKPQSSCSGEVNWQAGSVEPGPQTEILGTVGGEE